MMNNKKVFLIVGLALGLSGFASLVYEILWIRYFSYLLGGTVISLSMVSAVFLGGLALGYRYLGRLGDRLNRPLLFYAGLEVGIAVFSLLPTLTFNHLPKLVDPLFLSMADAPGLLLVFQFLLVCMLILPCTICMGGTVPIILAVFHNSPMAEALSRFYFINTLGAAFGTLATVFLLLPKLGMNNSHLLAVTLSLSSGALAWLVGRNIPQKEILAPTERPSSIKLEPALAVLTFLCGFFILACEILWSRLLMLYLGNTIFAFGIILGIVLLSIAAGSILYSRLPARTVHSWKFSALLMLTMVLSVSIPALYYDQAVNLFLQANLIAGDSWGQLILLQLAAVALLIGLPTFCSGLFFPLLAGMSRHAEHYRSQVAGKIGFWNTGGTITGSLLSAFLVLPVFGLQNGFLLLSSLVSVIGLIVIIFQLGRHSRKTFLWATGMVIVVGLPWLLSSPWDQKMVHSGIYLYTPYYKDIGGLKRGLGQNRLLFSRHDRESSVSINENRSGERSLVINGKVDASSGHDIATQYLLAHLPMLHHPSPEKVMVIGLGSGVTLGSAALYPAKKLDCLEISPAVVEASVFFSTVNRNVLNDPRVRLKINDGMYYLRTKGERYDVIISEPSNPWQRGNANLFSHDFYQHIQNRLNKGGVFCQWIPLYDLSPEHLKSALATFQTSFKNTLLFLNSGDLLILGSNAPIPQITGQAAVYPPVRKQLMEIGIASTAGLYHKKLLYSGDRLQPYLQNITINSLERSALEFAAKPLFTSGLIGPYLAANTEWLRSIKK